MIAQRLVKEGNAGETAALVYDLGIWGEQYSLCVWMLLSKGIEAAATRLRGTAPSARSRRQHWCAVASTLKGELLFARHNPLVRRRSSLQLSMHPTSLC